MENKVSDDPSATDLFGYGLLGDYGSALLPSRNHELADFFFERIREEIQEEEEAVQEGLEVAVYCYLHGGETIRVEDFGYMNPKTLLVYGLDHRQLRTVAMVHIASAQIVVKWEPILNTQKTCRIGFIGNVRDRQPT